MVAGFRQATLMLSLLHTMRGEKSWTSGRSKFKPCTSPETCAARLSTIWRILKHEPRWSGRSRLCTRDLTIYPPLASVWRHRCSTKAGSCTPGVRNRPLLCIAPSSKRCPVCLKCRRLRRTSPGWYMILRWMTPRFGIVSFDTKSSIHVFSQLWRVSPCRRLARSRASLSSYKPDLTTSLKTPIRQMLQRFRTSSSSEA